MAADEGRRTADGQAAPQAQARQPRQATGESAPPEVQAASLRELTETRDRLNEPVLAHVRRDFPRLKPGMNVEQALASIREQGLGERIVYFYVLDDVGRLLGVLPTRRLLTAPLHAQLSSLMISRVVTIPDRVTLFDACEYFVLHKFLAIPVVDRERRMLGILDVDLFTKEVFDLAEHDQIEEVFEALGFRLSAVRDASAIKAFRYRFPWLLATITSGLLCAWMASRFEHTLARSIVLAFFLTLVLALGESVSIQSMTVAIQALRASRPTWRWFRRTLAREALTAGLLGASCGALTGAIVFAWRHEAAPALALAGSLFVALIAAALFGLGVPSLLHALKLDPKIAAGPLSLALTDLTTLFSYFALATLLL